MPIDYRLVADLEEGLGDEHLSEIRFGRSRFLRNAGLALFGLAAGVFAAPPQEAEAAPPAAMGTDMPHLQGSFCVRCRGRFRSHCPPRGESNACWRSRYNGRCIRCCDWINAFGRPCICRGYC